MDVKTAAGQHIMAGLPGTEIDPAFAALVRECKVGNVILFRRNVKNAAQLARLCASLRELIVSETGMEPFIAIDQEGGVVSRFSPDMATTPGAMALAAAGGDAPYRAARLTAAQLRAAGVNFDLAPVLDVNSNPLNPVIGVRSFGDLPEEAAERAMGLCAACLTGASWPAANISRVTATPTRTRTSACRAWIRAANSWKNANCCLSAAPLRPVYPP